MARKRRRLREVHERRWWERYSRAEPIKDMYPKIKELTIRLRFPDPDPVDPDPARRLSEKVRNFGPHDTAFFEFKCPLIECVDGGFNLTDSVSQLIEKKQPESSGERICQGWQDEERINKHRCLCKLNFTISATYH